MKFFKYILLVVGIIKIVDAFYGLFLPHTPYRYFGMELPYWVSIVKDFIMGISFLVLGYYYRKQ
jgi:hypothetical protein